MRSRQHCAHTAKAIRWPAHTGVRSLFVSFHSQYMHNGGRCYILCSGLFTKITALHISLCLVGARPFFLLLLHAFLSWRFNCAVLSERMVCGMPCAEHRSITNTIVHALNRLELPMCKWCRSHVRPFESASDHCCAKVKKDLLSLKSYEPLNRRASS